MTSIDELLNLGPTSAKWLREAGITTLAELEKVGAIGAFEAVQAVGYEPNAVFAYAVQGALINCHWNALPLSMKETLKREVRAIQGR